MKKFKRTLSLFLAVVMCLGMLQIPVLAAGETDGHTHNEDGWVCTQTEDTRELTCTEHVHTDDCFETQEGGLICQEDEHTHDDSCYAEDGAELICEASEHTHNEDCYSEGETVKVCDEEDHEHTDDCYTVAEGEWTCLHIETSEEEIPEKETSEEEGSEKETEMETPEAPIAEPKEETPAEVQAFLNAVAALPSADSVTPENAEEIGEQVEAALDMWDTMDEELSAREDVNAALEAVYAVYEAVLAAEDIEVSMYSEAQLEYATGVDGLEKSAFENAYNLDQSDTCYGIVKLNGEEVTDWGTPNVWATGGWSGSVNVTGYNWVHITNSNPNVATATYTVEGGKLLITFTPGQSSGTTNISVGVDARYPHYSLGTWNMNLNFDYKVTNGSSSVSGEELGTVTRSVTYDLSTDKAVWGKEPYDSQYGERGSIGVGIINDVEIRQTYGPTLYYSFYATEMLDIAVGDYDTSIAAVEVREIENLKAADSLGNTTMKGVYIKVTGLKAGTTQVVVTPKFKIPTTEDGEYAYYVERTMPITVYIKVTGEKSNTNYELIYDANGGAVGTGDQALKKWSIEQSSPEFTVAAAEPTRSGYTFKGWADTDNATTPQYAANDMITLTKTQPTKTIYAVWEKVSEPEKLNYTIFREYYIDGTKVATVKSGEKDGEVGDKIVGSQLNQDNPKWSYYTMDGEKLKFEYKYSTPEVLTLTAGATDAKITLRYEIHYTVTKTPSTTEPVVGEDFMYTIKVTNDSGSNAIVKVTDELPAELTFVSASDGGTCNGQTVTWENITVPANGSKEVTVTVKANTKGEIKNEAVVKLPVKTIKADATVTAKDPDPVRKPNIAVTKSNDGLKLNEKTGKLEVNYTVTVTNKSDFDLYGLRLTDTMDQPILTPDTGKVKLTFDNFMVRTAADGKFAPIEPIKGGEEDLEHVLQLLPRDEEFKDEQTVTLTYTVEVENMTNAAVKVKLNNTAMGASWSKAPNSVVALLLSALSDDDEPDVTGSASSSTGDGSIGGSGSSSTEGELPAKYSVKYDWNLPEGANETLPAEKHYSAGVTVNVDEKYTKGLETVVGEGENAKTYVFSGWSTDDADVKDNEFTMPEKDVTIKGIWTLVPKEPEKILKVTADDVTVTYDGKGHVVTPVVTLNDETVKDAVPVITYEDEDGNKVEIPVNAGTYTARISVTVDGLTAETTAKVIINKRPLTVTTSSASKTYDGTPLTKDDAKVEITDGPVEGEEITATATGSQTEVGSSDNTYKMNWGTANPNNYEIKKEVLGTLTVTEKIQKPVDPDEKKLKVTADDVTVTYDGKGHVVTPVVTLNDETVKDAVPDITYEDEDGNKVEIPVNAGTYTAKISVTVDGLTAETTAKVIINKRPLTVTTGSASKTYDGTPLTKDDAKVEVTGGPVEGEEITATATGSQTEVGSSDNTYEMNWGTANPDNYEIKDDVLGTLTVTKKIQTPVDPDDPDDDDDDDNTPNPPRGGNDDDDDGNTTPVDIPDDDVPLTDIPDTGAPLTDVPGELADIPEEEVPLTDVPGELADIPEEEVPLTDVPGELADIPEEEVPLTDVPGELADIPDEDVPLADVPKTGDNSQIWGILTMLSGAGLAWLALEDRKSKTAK